MRTTLRHSFQALLVISVSLSCGEEAPSPTGPARSIRPSLNDPGINAIPADTDTDGDGLFDQQEEILVRRYMPYWDFDGQEFIRPISVEDWANWGGSVRNSPSSSTGPSYNSLSSLLTAVNTYPSGIMFTNTNSLMVGWPFCNGTQAQGDPLYDPTCNDAPIYVEAQPIPGCFSGKCDLVWLHYYLFWHGDVKDVSWAGGFGTKRHWGDWEHMCVLATKAALSSKTVAPLAMHWHHHGDATYSLSAYKYYSDPKCVSEGTNSPNCWGTKHPAAYVEAGAHGVYRAPGTHVMPHRGFGAHDDLTNNPFMFFTPHYTNRTKSTDEVIRAFRGRWGQTHESGSLPFVPDNFSPLGPNVFNDICDHDIVSGATVETWKVVFSCDDE